MDARRGPEEIDSDSGGRGDAVVAAGTALLFLASFVAFWPALRGAFIWDDTLNILTNPVIHSDRGLIEIWTGGRDVYDYYPLTWTTWWLEWRAWRRDTLGYHVLNVLLHAGAAGLLWRVFVRLQIPGAFAAALLFAVHPVNVETVAWISERKNTLSMFLLAITLALYLDAERQDTPGRRRAFYWASVGAFALALLAKPSVVPLPLVLLALAWWRRGQVARADVWRAAPFFVLSAAISAITVAVHHGRSIIDSEVRTDGFASRLAGAGWAVWFYLYKLFWPAELSFVYPRWHIDPRSPLHWLPLAALVATFALLYVVRGRVGRGPFVALACYVAMLLPVLGFVNVYFMRYSFVSDHWQYAACPAALALASAGAAVALRRLPSDVRAPIGVVLMAAACGTLGFLAWREAHLFRTNEALWADVARDNARGFIGHNNYGAELWGRGRKDEARAKYMLAIELDPRAREPYVSMGRSYMLEGKPADAIPWFRKAVSLPGGGRDPRVHLAEALAAVGQVAEAIEWYERAERDYPYADFRPQLAGLQDEYGGRPDRAIELYRKHAKTWPKEPESWFLLASALRKHGQVDEAAEAFAEARRLCGEDHVTLAAMGNRMIVAGHFDLAADALRDAIRVKPDYGPAHNHLGRTLEGLGSPDAAARAYAEAVRVQPGFREAAMNLARLRPPGGPPSTTTAPAESP